VPSVVTLTMNPTIDKSAAIGHVAPDRKLRCEEPRHDPGGGGVNVSRAMRRLGGQSLALYPAGGALGQLLQELLDEEGVRHQAIPINGMTRENLTVAEASTGQQYRFGMPGPSLEEEDWQRCLEELSTLESGPDYVVASGSLPLGVPDDFYARVARQVHDRGGRLLLDTSEEPLRAAAAEGVYLLKPNMRELRQLAQSDIEDEAAQEAAVRELVERGQAEVVLLSLGAAGALLATADRLERLRAPSVPIKSKIGAGDSMVAGIVLGLSRGRSVVEAALLGIAAGSAAVMTPGTELCRREDTERLFKQLLANRSRP